MIKYLSDICSTLYCDDALLNTLAGVLERGAYKHLNEMRLEISHITAKAGHGTLNQIDRQ